MSAGVIPDSIQFCAAAARVPANTVEDQRENQSRTIGEKPGAYPERTATLNYRVQLKDKARSFVYIVKKWEKYALCHQWRLPVFIRKPPAGIGQLLA